MNEGQTSKFLFVFEGIGTIFIGAFLVAYLLGLPTDIVYHSDPTLSLVLSIFGGIFIFVNLCSINRFKVDNKKRIKSF